MTECVSAWRSTSDVTVCWCAGVCVVLREENERMRQYMEVLVSKAIATCPQILCVDTSKIF